MAKRRKRTNIIRKKNYKMRQTREDESPNLDTISSLHNDSRLSRFFFKENRQIRKKHRNNECKAFRNKHPSWLVMLGLVMILHET